MNKPEIILIGGGGHCVSSIDVIEMHDRYKIAGIIDVSENIGKMVLGYPIIGCDNDLEGLSKFYRYFIITLGQIRDYSIRERIFDNLNSLKVEIPIIISPLAYVSKYASIGFGTVVMHYAMINAGASIGQNCIINTKALVEHNAIVGNHCHISTGAIVNGGVEIGDYSFYGSGAVSKENISIPRNSFIKANSIVK